MDDLRTARERGWRALSDIDRALESGEIDEAEWHARALSLIEPAYLAATTPQGGSGHSGDAARWEQARRLLMDAVDRSGTFLDVGCANGLLMESVAEWSGGDLEPYGVEISPALADLARRRCPQWADRIWTGNARSFDPGRRFTYVRTGLDYVPAAAGPAYVRHLLGLVEDGGALIVGVSNEEPGEPGNAGRLAGWGLEVSGGATRPHRDPRLVYTCCWVRS